MDIQETVRLAVQKADAKIGQLTERGEITGIAQTYFQDYLQKIASYNRLRLKQSISSSPINPI